MGKVIRLTESDLKRIIERVMNEQFNNFSEIEQMNDEDSNLIYEDIYGSVESTDFVADDILTEAEYKGRKVKLNKPFLTPNGPKKRSVYVKNEKGNVVKVNFGDPNMRIKKSNPARRKSFRARHNCQNPGPKTFPRYWSCRAW